MISNLSKLWTLQTEHLEKKVWVEFSTVHIYESNQPMCFFQNILCWGVHGRSISLFFNLPCRHHQLLNIGKILWESICDCPGLECNKCDQLFLQFPFSPFRHQLFLQLTILTWTTRKLKRDFEKKAETWFVTVQGWNVKNFLSPTW